MPHSKSVLFIRSNTNPLNLLKDALLELTLHLLALLVRGRLAVEGEQAAKVELGLLQQLNLADVNLYVALMSVLRFSLHTAPATYCAQLPCPAQKMALHVRSGEGRCPGWPSQSRGQ